MKPNKNRIYVDVVMPEIEEEPEEDDGHDSTHAGPAGNAETAVGKATPTEPQIISGLHRC